MEVQIKEELQNEKDALVGFDAVFLRYSALSLL